ncbi:MAG: PDZ domain-containing protein [Ignavibacteria bacterium]|nr:PDZ domain-containing protein [Ignavibacteria bacterium]
MLHSINYTISFANPATHYCEIEINFNKISSDKVTLFLPVWTPGSYMVREFARQVQNVQAFSASGKNLAICKTRKNHWLVETNGEDSFTVKYKVYCNELTVRTSEINDEHAFINCSNVFMSAKGMENEKCSVKVNPHSSWKNISTGLEKTGDNLYEADNYDILADSPIEIGNQNILEFEILGTKHFICLYGRGNYDEETLVKDFKRIAEAQINFFGGMPYKHYTYICHLVEKGGGGLEHLNSFAVQFPRWSFTDDKSYKQFLGLVSHEFFHLWNVKRIRPLELGPFDYDNENYTFGLWEAEGWTSIYDNIFIRRCGVLDNKGYYEFIEKEVNDIMRFQGRFNQTLLESSYDTWIKYYRQDENSKNSTVSYYTKGALVALMLNIEIITSSNCEKSLDDALKTLWEDYKKDPSKGFTNERIKEICEELAGKDLSEFWDKYLAGLDELPLFNYLQKAGLQAVNTRENHLTFDIEINQISGKVIVAKVFEGGSGYTAGLNNGDEIIAINDVRIEKDYDKILKNYKLNDEVKVLINRKGFMREFNIILTPAIPLYEISEIENMTDGQRKVLNKWLLG